MIGGAGAVGPQPDARAGSQQGEGFDLAGPSGSDSGGSQSGEAGRGLDEGPIGLGLPSPLDYGGAPL